MCNAQAAMMGMTAAGNMMTSRNQHRNQMGQLAAHRQALEQTNQRQMMLREMERERQRDFNRRQQQGFGQSLAAAHPDRIREAEGEAQDLRRATAQAVRDGTSADVPLPGGSIPGTGGLAAQGMRTVGQNLDADASQLADATANLQGLPAALGGLGELFAPGQHQIGIAGDASQRSRSLLPAELDAARIAPRIPAPRSNVLGQLLAGLGTMGSQMAGIQQGRQVRTDEANDILEQMFPNGVPGFGFRAAGTPQLPRARFFGGGGGG